MTYTRLDTFTKLKAYITTYINSISGLTKTIVNSGITYLGRISAGGSYWNTLLCMNSYIEPDSSGGELESYIGASRALSSNPIDLCNMASYYTSDDGSGNYYNSYIEPLHVSTASTGQLNIYDIYAVNTNSSFTRNYWFTGSTIACNPPTSDTNYLAARRASIGAASRFSVAALTDTCIELCTQLNQLGGDINENHIKTLNSIKEGYETIEEEEWQEVE